MDVRTDGRTDILITNAMGCEPQLAHFGKFFGGGGNVHLKLAKLSADRAFTDSWFHVGRVRLLLVLTVLPWSHYTVQSLIPFPLDLWTLDGRRVSNLSPDDGRPRVTVSGARQADRASWDDRVHCGRSKREERQF